jgi:hypothetical protein
MFDKCERICSLNCDENGDKLHFLAHLGMARKAEAISMESGSPKGGGCLTKW